MTSVRDKLFINTSFKFSVMESLMHTEISLSQLVNKKIKFEKLLLL